MTEYKLLIVDDEPQLLSQVVELLDSEYQVSVARDGQTALELTEREPPDLILLDIIMPEMDGYEVCRRLKQNPGTQDIAVIFLSTKDDPGAEAYGIELGATDYLSKPISPPLLLARVRNILKLKTSLDDLKKVRSDAEVANRAKSFFLANMGHELRTPLNAILGFSSLLRKETQLSLEQIDKLDIINRSGEHLLSLINDVLEMSRIEAGRIALEISPFDLHNMVRDIADMMYERAYNKGLQLIIDPSSEFPRYIKGDEARLRQIMINLVGNAVKYTQEGSITMRLGIRQNTKAHLVIEIKDTGSGISVADQEHIFEPFKRLDEQNNYQGSGLGLTITRQFVLMMEGSITLESTLGKGSVFRVDLPLEEVREMDFRATPIAQEEGEVTGLMPNQPDYRILIVEDQFESQLLLKKLMEYLGLPVKVAENGQQCIEIFKSWQPHLIWMDIRMPVTDGMETTRAIRQLPGGKDVKIVAVTASALVEQRMEMLNAGMDDFINKPYRFNEIYHCLSQLLGVKYLYAKQSSPETTLPLTASMMAVLPPALRREFREALESLEEESINAVIQQVAAYDVDLQHRLSRLADNYNYPVILKALDIDTAEGSETWERA